MVISLYLAACTIALSITLLLKFTIVLPMVFTVAIEHGGIVPILTVSELKIFPTPSCASIMRSTFEIGVLFRFSITAFTEVFTFMTGSCIRSADEGRSLGEMPEPSLR